jgi:predicted dithiol-disulfide oxidoreductase (DUF899 family)
MDFNYSNPAEKEIFELEANLMKEAERLATLKRKQPSVPVIDYNLTDLNGQLKISQLFGQKNSLLVIHNMGSSCNYCTLWADTFNGFLHHLESESSVILCTPDSPELQRQFALSRGWKFRMVSDQEKSFSKDSGYLKEDGKFWPGYSTYSKNSDSQIIRTGRGVFGPMDLYCGLWHLIPNLANSEWHPKKSYL